MKVGFHLIVVISRYKTMGNTTTICRQFYFGIVEVDHLNAIISSLQSIINYVYNVCFSLIDIICCLIFVLLYCYSFCIFLYFTMAVMQ